VLFSLQQAIAPSRLPSVFPLPPLPWPGGMREAIK